ncbi:hypothetical protein BDV06DRAFT_205997 [Aspergillus oleicola]
MEHLGESEGEISGDWGGRLILPHLLHCCYAFLILPLSAPCFATYRLKMSPSPISCDTAKQDTLKVDPVKDWVEYSPDHNRSSDVMAIYHSYDEDYLRTAEGQL